jgi:DUF971 family protein
MELTPVKISKSSDFAMSIQWTDGSSSELSFKQLRYSCECAECVDEWTRRRKVTKEQIASDIHPIRLEPVGRYAIQIQWSDGHRTGIYPYSQLYKIAQSEKESK